MGDYSVLEKLVLYSLGNQTGPGIVVVNHASHLYNHCTLAEYQLISTFTSLRVFRASKHLMPYRTYIDSV